MVDDYVTILSPQSSITKDLTMLWTSASGLCERLTYVFLLALSQLCDRVLPDVCLFKSDDAEGDVSVTTQSHVQHEGSVCALTFEQAYKLSARRHRGIRRAFALATTAHTCRYPTNKKKRKTYS